MARKNANIKTSVDFDIGIDMIIPSTQEAFKKDNFSEARRKDEKSGLGTFRQTFLQRVESDLKHTKQFPTDKEVFVFIVQYFVSQKDYKSRDVDNMAKTILDVLNGKFYKDDGQVKTLLVTKKMEPRVTQNFAYIAIKELKEGKDIEALKMSGVERSITMFQELKSKGII